jgi:hypothetical protein
MRLDALYRALARLAPLCAFFTLACATAGAQEPQHVKEQRHLKKVDFALYAAEATVRSLDLVSTHALLTAPCKCFYEADPIAPGGRDVVPQVAFHSGVSAAIIVGHRELVRHRHPRLARLLIVADIVSETWAVQNNFRLHENTPQLGNSPVAAGQTSKARVF